jgi:hypothetical protein
MSVSSTEESVLPPESETFAPAGTVVSSSGADGTSAVFVAGRGQQGSGPGVAGDSEYDEALAREFATALDLSTWTSGEKLAELSERLERDVALAARHEGEMGPKIISVLREQLPSAPDRSSESGIYDLSPDVITGACRNVLFNGNVEACDGTRIVVNTLPVTVFQIGICLTSYLGTGDGGSIVHRLYRHDITRPNSDVEAQVRDFIRRRARRKRRMGENGDGQSSPLSDLLCRALMIYGERAMLAERSDRSWRLGHGSPMPHEMLVGSGREELTWASLKVLRTLLEGHKRFISVPSEISDQAVVTIANSLQPLQYAVLRNTRDIIQGYITNSSYERPHYKDKGIYQALRAFQDDVGSKVLLCVYRTSWFSPGGVFYAHEDCVHQAAQIVLADSALQEHRGFPNLIDIADRMCRGMFDSGGVAAQVHAVLARSGAPFRYFNERSTRN